MSTVRRLEFGDNATAHNTGRNHGYEHHSITLTGTVAAAVTRESQFSGDEAEAISVQVTPTGAFTGSVERSIDEGATWFALPTAITYSGITAAVLHDIPLPVGRYRVKATTITTSVAIVVRKKVRVVR